MENKICGYVYLITNLINGKQYVGQTIRTLRIRFSKHCTSKNPVISKAIKKYGKENFIVQELAIAYNQKQLDFLEGMYMSWFNTLAPNGYNITNIINGKGKHSKETIEKFKKIQNNPDRLKISSNQGKKFRSKKPTRKGLTSKYLGVSKKYNKYRAIIYFNKTIHIGMYNTEIDAAKAYDIKALELLGTNAILNFPELRQDYIKNKIIINNNKKEATSGEKNVYFNNNVNKWYFKWFEKDLNKYKTKYFTSLEKAIEFKKNYT